MAATPKDLLEHIDFSNLECLNEKHGHPAANALKQGYREDGGLFCESDTDEQLLFNIPFQQKVKIQSITIKGPADGSAPKSVKIYVNRTSMGFSDVDSVPAALSVSLSGAGSEEGETVVLKLAKFSNVTQISLFVESNQGDEETTKVSKIGLSGWAGETFNVAEIKKQEEGQ
ncbi:MAG: PITH domain-containing protein [Monoraphidium minutum]|nr:MAG: PITH domain-containing protein [Monoraphidium minutum]